MLGGAGATNVPLNALAGDFTPPALRGKVFTALTLAHAFSGVLSTLISATALHLRLTSYVVPFLGLAALAPLGFAPLTTLSSAEPGRLAGGPSSIPPCSHPRGWLRSLRSGARSLGALLASSSLLRGLSAAFAAIGFGAGGVRHGNSRTPTSEF